MSGGPGHEHATDTVTDPAGTTGTSGVRPPGPTRRPGRRYDPLTLGPGDLLWSYAGDQRFVFTGLPAGLLQLMHPAIGAGVIDHSAFFTDPWGRIIRSYPEIIGTIYDGGTGTGHKVRDLHTTISGTDGRGRPYHALRPETFWWAHATFQVAVSDIIDRFDRRTLTAADREELYRQGIEWYRRYGVSMRPVPPDHRAFVAEWDRVCLEVLEMTPAAERAVDMALHDRLQDLPDLPAWTNPLQRHLVTPILRLASIGGLPPIVRARFRIPWGIRDELELRALEHLVRATWPALPAGARYHPRARAGHRRARFRVGVGEGTAPDPEPAGTGT